jgi:hypothetical protein
MNHMNELYAVLIFFRNCHVSVVNVTRDEAAHLVEKTVDGYPDHEQLQRAFRFYGPHTSRFGNGGMKVAPFFTFYIKSYIQP